MSQHEEWRCGTCSYWRKDHVGIFHEYGECDSREAVMLIASIRQDGVERVLRTADNFGCRFWAGKPLNEQAS